MSKPTAVSQLTTSEVLHIAELAGIPVSNEEVAELVKGFEKTLSVVNNLQSLPTDNVSLVRTPEPLDSHCFREDVIDESREFSQNQALQNASHTHNGYIVVPQVREEK